MNYRIDLDDFIEEIFEELEKISEGRHGHELIISASDAAEASQIACTKLLPLFKKHFIEAGN